MDDQGLPIPAKAMLEQAQHVEIGALSTDFTRLRLFFAKLVYFSQRHAVLRILNFFAPEAYPLRFPESPPPAPGSLPRSYRPSVPLW